jgi:hypothetical protein
VQRFEQPKQTTIMAVTRVFIDSRVNDKELLISQFAPGTDYQVLDANRDGIDQIVTALSGQSGYDSIQIISHGASGSITIGSTLLNSSTLDSYAAQLALLGSALTEIGDLLLYGCSVGAGDQGQHFIDTLSQMTGADVAASDDPTGGTAAGGDWVLEVQTGVIGEPGFNPQALASFDGLLVAPTLTAFSGPVDTTSEDCEVEITFAELAAKGNQADADGTVNAFVIKTINRGTIRIGPDSASAIPFNGWTNNTIDETHNAYWTPVLNANGVLNAFTVVACDDSGAESLTAIQSTVSVTGVNDSPVIYTPLVTKADYLTGVAPKSLITADLNGDGKIDVIVANSGTNTVSVLLNSGDGTFNTKVDYTTDTNPSSVALADVNGDGKADLVVGNYGSNTVSVLLGTGNGTFIEKKDYAINATQWSVKSADINGDGMADLIVTNYNNNSVSVLKNNGDGTFSAKVVDFSSGGGGYSITLADINGDGKSDLIIPNPGNCSISVLLNDGTGYFTSKVVYNYYFYVGYFPSLVTPADLNSDGKTDLIVSDCILKGGAYLSSASVLLGNGDGTFGARVIYDTGIIPGSVTNADVNGDGKEETLVANIGSNTISVSTTTQQVTPTLFIEQTPVKVNPAIVINDIDGNASWNDGSLTVKITVNAEVADKLTLPTVNPGGSGIWLDMTGNKLMAGTTQIGTADAVSVSYAEAWLLSFNGNATSSLVQDVARAVTFNNSSNAPGTLDRSISFTVMDNLGAYASMVTPVTITPVNDLPTLTLFTSPVETTSEDIQVGISFTDLAGKGDQADDGVVEAFVVKSVSSGTLRIGSSADTAIIYNGLSNNTIDATHHAYWTPCQNVYGTFNAFTVVARDNAGIESSTAIQTTVAVTPVNDVPVVSQPLSLSFAAKVDYYATGNGNLVTSTDVNSDGKPDLIVSTIGWDSGTVSVLLNNGDGTFASKVDYASGTGTYFVASADVNGDGKTDLVVANQGTYPTWVGTVSVLMNNGNGIFTSRVDYATGNVTRSVTTADVNSDGKADLVVANYGIYPDWISTVSVLLNLGDGTFASKVDYATGIATCFVTTADVNGDGKADLIFANAGSNTVSVLLNNGDGTFAAKEDYATGSNPHSITVADVNGDGKADLIAANYSGVGVSVLLNNGNGTFATKVDYATVSYLNSMTSADVNGDGKADLIVQQQGRNTVSVLFGNGDGTFVYKVDHVTATYPYSVSSADFNGDGKEDLIAACSGVVSVLLNTSVGAVTSGLTSYIEQTPAKVNSGIFIFDVDGDPSWNGGSLTIQITSNAEAADCLSLTTVNPGGSGIWLDTTGNKVMAGMTQIGTANAVSVTNATVWQMSFNAHATNALLRDVADAIIFNNSSDAPGTLDRSISFTATDNSGGSASLTQTVTVTAVNDLPTLTLFNGAVDTTIETTEVEITFAELVAKGNETDVDGTVESFHIKSVSSGNLRIGLDAASATIYNIATNNTIDATHHAYWAPVPHASGALNAFMAVACDNSGGESLTALSVVVNVTAITDAPVMYKLGQLSIAFIEQTPVNVSSDIVIEHPKGDAMWNGGSFTLQVTSNAEAADTLSLPAVNPGGSGIWLDPDGNRLMSGTTQIGTADAVLVSNTTLWRLSLNTNATSALVQDVARAVIFNNSRDDVGTLDRGISFIATDNFGASASFIQRVTITPVNDVPVLTAFSGPVDTTSEDTLVEITYADLNTTAVASDVDGTIESFVIKALSSGTLRIGSSAATATPYTWGGTNNTIDAAHHAYWIPAANANGTLEAFSAVARDNNGGESLTAIKATVDVTAVNEKIGIYSPLVLSFAPKADYPTTNPNWPSWPNYVTSSDVNSDGTMDLVVANYGSNSLSVFKNNGNGTFAARVDYATGLNPDSVTSADVNGDGKADLIVANKGSNTVSVLTNKGDGTFIKVDYATGISRSAFSRPYVNEAFVVSSDVNGDGKADIVVTNPGSNTVSVLINNGNGTFAAKVDYATGIDPRCVTVADVTGDGSSDLVVANVFNDTVSVLTNNGNGTFAAKIDYPTGSFPVSVTSGDFNSDGKIDLVVTNFTSSLNTISVLLNNGDGTFAAKVAYATGDIPCFVTTGDVNGDKTTDLIVANYGSNSVSVLTGNGDGTFATKIDYAPGYYPVSVASSDLNGDGNAELIVAYSGPSVVSVLTNTSQAATSFIEQTPVKVNSGIIINHPKGDASWNGGSLTAQITANSETADTLSLPTGNPGDNGIWLDTAGKKLMAGTTQIGLAEMSSVSNAVLWNFTFNENITNTLVQNVARAVIYNNSSDTPGTLDRSINFSVTDNLGESASIVQSVTVTAVNDAPTLTSLSGVVDTTNEDTEVEIHFEELFSKAVASDIDGIVSPLFVVKAINSGMLKIGTDVFSAAAYNALSNNIIDATHHAYWTPAFNVNGTLDAFSIAAQDNSGVESVATMQAKVVVTHQKDQPVMYRSSIPSSFASKVDYAAGSYSLTSGDVSGDGKPDLVVGGINTVSVLMNTGNGTFASKVDYATGSRPYSLISSDVNGDGKLDLVAANAGSNTVFVLMNTGNGTFASKVDYATGGSPYSVTSSDVNGDGQADLIAANAGSNTASVLMNTGNGIFASKVDYATGGSPYSVTSSDVNGDGQADLVVANAGSNTVSVLMNMGNGTFSSKIDYLTGSSPHSVISSDVNGDGKPDLIVANQVYNYYSDQTVSVLLNNGNGTFASKVDYVIGATLNSYSTQKFSVTSADINGDSKADIIVANVFNDTVDVLLNNGNGTFATKVEYAGGIRPSAIISADFTGDGKSDIIFTSGYYSDTASVLMNSSMFDTTNFVERTPVQVIGSININHPDGDASWNGGSLSVQITANAEVDDSLSLQTVNSGGSGIWFDTASKRLMAGTIQIGAVDAASVSNGVWHLSFNANATTALVQDVARAITFNNSSDIPALTGRTISLTIADNLGGSASIVQTVQVVNVAPTLTVFRGDVNATSEDTQVAITFAELAARGDQADFDDTVDAFVVKAVSSGSLLIGTSVATAKAYAKGNNDTIDATHHAYWVPELNANGTLNAFTVVARDSRGAESETAIQATVDVTAVNNDVPIMDQPSVVLSFGPNEDYATGSYSQSITGIDVNGDGKVDFVFVNPSGNTVSVLKNNGDGTFADKVDYATGDWPESVTSADVNGDSKEDLIVVNGSIDTVSVLKNNGDGTFSAKVDYATGRYPRFVTTADVNEDGKADLVVANYFSDTISVLLNKGDGTFATKIDYADLSTFSDYADLSTFSITSADVNGDGKVDLIDLIVANLSTVSTRADFNGDGKIDIVTVNAISRTLSVLLNNGNGTFAAKVDYAVGTSRDFQPVFVTNADVNGDGKSDLIVANSRDSNPGQTISVLLNNGKGIFSTKVDYTVGEGPSSVTSGDVNGDGKADLIVLNSSSNTVSVLKNTSDIVLFIEQTPVHVSNNLVVYHPDGDVNWNGGSLSIQITGNAEAADSLSFSTDNPGGTVIWLNTIGNKLMAGTTQIGTADAALVSNAVAWHLSFNANATNELVQDVARAVIFNNSSDTPSILPRGITFTATDNLGGLASVVQTLTVTAINDAPLPSDFSKIGNRDTDIAFSTADFLSHFDVDGGDTPLSAIKVLSLPGQGTLKLNGTLVTLNQEINTANLSKLIFVPNANWYGRDSFVWNASNGATYFETSAKVNLTVDTKPTVLVSDTSSHVSTSFIEQTPVIVSNTIVITDPDGDASWDGGFLDVQISANASLADSLSLATVNPGGNGIWLEVTSNTLMAGDTAIGTADAVSVFSGAIWRFTLNANTTNALVQDVARAVTFTNNSDAPNIADRTISFSATDNLGLLASVDQIVTITPVNDLPQGSVSITGLVRQGEILTAVSAIADADGLGTISYKWQADGVDIDGATGSTLLLGNPEVGKTITVKASYTDGYGAPESVMSSPTIGVALDTIAPSVSITSSANALKAGETATITFTFSEDPGASFVDTDILTIGGTLGSLSGSGLVRTAIFTPTASLASSSASITVASGNYADTAGNEGSAGTPPTLMIDTLEPTITTVTPTDSAVGVAIGSDIILTFSEVIQRGMGNIDIHSGSATGHRVQSYNAATDTTHLSISGNTLTINSMSNLSNGTHYFVTFAEGSVEDLAGNHFAGLDTYDFTTVAPPASFFDLTGSVHFWKSGAAIAGVTSTLDSAPAATGSQLVEFRNIQVAADGTRTIEIWETSARTDIGSVQLELALPTGSVATWVDAAGLPSGWSSVPNTGLAGQFILGGFGTTALSAGPVKLGTLTLTAPTNPQHFDLSLTAGELGTDSVPAFGIVSDSMTTDIDGLYQHLDMADGTYALTSAKVSGTAEGTAIKANDALAALKIAVGMNPNADGSAVSPYQYLAADVNHDGQIKAADALNILKMAVKLSAAPAKEWLFVPDSVGSESMTRTHVVWPDNPVSVTLDIDQELHLIGIVKGDVNGSWVA